MIRKCFHTFLHYWQSASGRAGLDLDNAAPDNVLFVYVKSFSNGLGRYLQVLYKLCKSYFRPFQIAALAIFSNGSKECYLFALFEYSVLFKIRLTISRISHIVNRV